MAKRETYPPEWLLEARRLFAEGDGRSVSVKVEGPGGSEELEGWIEEQERRAQKGRAA